MEKLLNLHEAAEILGVKPPTVYNWTSEPKITIVKVGWLAKFDPQDIR